MSFPVSHIMRANVTFCEESTSLRNAAEMLLNKRIGSIVVNKGEESVIIFDNFELRALFTEE